MAWSVGSIVCPLHIRFAFILCVLCACSAKKEAERLPFYNTATFDAEWISESDPAYAKIHTIDTFSLINQIGNTITKDSLDGNIYVVNFFFTTCPSICPKMMFNLKTLQDTLFNEKNIKLVSFSVTPWKDSVSRLKEYAISNGILAGKWHLLTGSKERIYSLGRQSYFAEKTLGLQKSTNDFLHTETMLLIDSKARIRGIYNATQKVDLERILEDIATLKQEPIALK